MEAEQKNVSLLKDLVQKFRRPRDVVMDFCAVTSFTARACMSLDQHKKFLRCNVSFELLTAAEADLMLSLAA